MAREWDGEVIGGETGAWGGGMGGVAQLIDWVINKVSATSASPPNYPPFLLFTYHSTPSQSSFLLHRRCYYPTHIWVFCTHRVLWILAVGRIRLCP